MFNRVWDTPDNGYAEKFKHTIEPFLTISAPSSIDNFDRIIQIDGIDSIVGGTTRYTYGLNNRFYAKRQPRRGRDRPGAGDRRRRDAQTYYTDERASQYDRSTRPASAARRRATSRRSR